jgi:plasmid maintenance system antidote protein VapI
MKKNKMRCGVYRIVNRDSGKFYIGSSVSLDRRRNDHFSALKRDKHHSVYLQRAYNKEPSAFVFETLLVCDRSMTLFYEQLLIDSMKPEYNTSETAGATWRGVTGADNPTSKPIIELNTKRVFVCAADAAKKLNLKPPTISEVCRRKRSHTHGYQFAFLSEYEGEGFACPEIKNNKGANNGNARKVREATTNKTFDTATEAAAHFGISKMTVSRLCRNHKQSKDGYKFDYV